MGRRGPLPKSAEERLYEGERAHRPLPAARAHYPAGAPERPKGMTAAARRVWDAYMEQMASLGILRLVDVFALQRLCEDVAQLQELQKGMRQIAAEHGREAKMLAAEARRDDAAKDLLEKIVTEAEGTAKPKAKKQRVMPAPLAVFAMTHEGRRLTATINALAGRIGRSEQQYGLTPISGQRLESAGGMLPAPGVNQPIDPIEKQLCG